MKKFRYRDEIINAIEAEVRSTIEDMLDNPSNYFSLEGMEDEAIELNEAIIRKEIAARMFLTD